MWFRSVVAGFVFLAVVPAAQAQLKTDTVVGKGAEAVAGKTVVVNYRLVVRR